MEDFLKPNETSLFRFVLPRENCTFDGRDGVVKCGNLTMDDSLPPHVAPPRCGWDNNFSPPPVPYYDETSQLCHNAVLQVNYNFTWAGTKLLLLNATLILGNVPLEVVRTEMVEMEYTEIIPERIDTVNITVANMTVGNVTLVNATVTQNVTVPERVEVRSWQKEIRTVYPARLSQVFVTSFSHSSSSSGGGGGTDNATDPGMPPDKSGKPGTCRLGANSKGRLSQGPICP